MASSKASSGNRSTIPYEVLHGMPVQHCGHVPYLEWLSNALSKLMMMFITIFAGD